jgi:hypothetical protein
MPTNDEIIKKTKDWCREWNYYLDEEYLEEEGYKLPFGVCNDRAVIPLELLEEKLNEITQQIFYDFNAKMIPIETADVTGFVGMKKEDFISFKKKYGIIETAK